MEVIHAEDQMPGVHVVEPVLLVHETDLESKGKREERVAAVDVIHAEDQMEGVHVVEPVLPVHETGWESKGNQEETVVSVEIIHAEDQMAGVHVVEPVLSLYMKLAQNLTASKKKLFLGWKLYT